MELLASKATFWIPDHKKINELLASKHQTPNRPDKEMTHPRALKHICRSGYTQLCYVFMVTHLTTCITKQDGMGNSLSSLNSNNIA